MKWDEKKISEVYQQIDADETGQIQRRIYEQICAKKHSFKRKTIWGLGIAAAVIAFIAVGLPLLQEPPYLPNPADFNRMNFAFYRDLAYDGYSWEMASTQPFPPIQD
ncbi:MAG: hypothetical protein J5601_06965 [Elusimicrobiaceae bacterium]|nr:hypothetical protein [Elusimicrobiaceae bacterium]